MNDNRTSVGNIVAISLILLLVGILIFLLLNASDTEEAVQQEKQIEKHQTQDAEKDFVEVETVFGGQKNLIDNKSSVSRSLDSLIIKYNQAIELNTSMSDELGEERKRVLILRDSVRALKSDDYGSIEEFKNKIKLFEAKNSELFAQNKSLIRKNDLLTSKLKNTESELEDANEEIDTLRTEVNKLNVKVSKAARIKIFNGNIYSMRKRRNNQFLETKKAKKTNAFRINFSLEPNKLADSGERRVYLQMTDEDGRVLSQIGSFRLENGEQVVYSDFVDANYSNTRARELVSLIEVNSASLKKGLFYANVFIDDYFAGSLEVLLR